jgi:Chalcone isomerase-like
MRRLLLALLLPALLGATAGPARAEKIAGVDYPPTITVAGQPLALNGAGIRYRFVVKVYTAGLYLGAPARSPEQVLAAPGPKRLHIQMLRDIDGNTLGKLFTRGMEDNSTRAQFAKAIAGTLRLAELFAAKKQLAEGEHFSIEWQPGKGTLIHVNGQPQGEPIAEPEFFAALMRIWLGPRPADEQLKRQLLGEKPAEPTAQVN